MKVSINYTLTEITLVHRSFIDFSIDKLNIDTVRKLSIVIDEVLSNIINYNREEALSHKINVEFKSHQNKIHLIFEDQGQAFNPLAITEPDTKVPLEMRAIGGLGILLIKKLVDDANYDREGHINRLILTKYVN